MRTELMSDLADCSKFRQTIQGRPPKIMHGTAILLVVLVGAAVTWASLTKASLVVQAEGRVRPRNGSEKSLTAVSGQKLSLQRSGRVLEVGFRLGEEVKEGQLLIRLDSERLDNDIAKQNVTIQKMANELRDWNKKAKRLEDELNAAEAKAKAELAEAEEEPERLKKAQESDIALAKVELARTKEEMDIARRAGFAVSRLELRTAEANNAAAQAKLDKCSQPIGQGRVRGARGALELVQNVSAGRRKEQEDNLLLKTSQVETAQLELNNLVLERKQTILRAPMDGIVTMGEVNPGDLLEAGKPVVAIAPQDGLRVDVAVPGKDVAHLRVGTPVRIKLDALDFERYGVLEGTVEFISPDSEVMEGERITYYLVKIAVRDIEVGRGQFRGRVKIGMTCKAEIVTGQESLLVLLAKKIRQSVSLD